MRDFWNILKKYYIANINCVNKFINNVPEPADGS